MHESRMNMHEMHEIRVAMHEMHEIRVDMHKMHAISCACALNLDVIRFTLKIAFNMADSISVHLEVLLPRV